eukprot:COSAG02_NODE_555_length_20407_cov_11.072878_6_plen_43_part_00
MSTQEEERLAQQAVRDKAKESAQRVAHLEKISSRLQEVDDTR